MKNHWQPLSDVDEHLIETGRFLDDITKDPEKKACLETFVQSQSIVQWLKSTTKGEIVFVCFLKTYIYCCSILSSHYV